jgi:catechol 2,3-dioxygenase-like lactoylglutathione lyase family enzyme
MRKKICGIQQIGIGYSDIQESWKWYRKYFGMNVPVFEDTAEATLMYQYTGNKVHNRHAILAMNMQGGAGFELWQFKNRKPLSPIIPIKIGDYGLQIIKIKTQDIFKTFQFYKEEGLDLKSEIEKDPKGDLHFYLQDPYQNLFEIVKSESWFCDKKQLTGGVNGIVIGVSDIEKAIKLYGDVLGYSNIVYDKTEIYADFKSLNGGNGQLRRVLLRHPEEKTGGFSKLFGATEIELIERQDKLGIKIYQNRYWGDNGFIHVCFDVIGMKLLKQECAEAGFPFTVDSENSFNMGKAAGHFAYIEDDDGTLIEFVETYKVPIIKKLGLYLNLRNKNPNKNLPTWLIKLMGLTAIKD